MYRTIVVGTDFSDTAARAVEQAAELAKTFGAALHVVTGFKPALTANIAASSLEAMAYGGSEYVQEAESKIAEEVSTMLERLAGDIAAEGVKVSTHGRPGDPSDIILDVAESEKADLIVVGNRGMSGIKRFVLGSVSSKVAHHAPCSVLVVHTTD